MDCWHDEIDRATNEAQVLKAAREYLALWGTQELAPVTRGWRELRVESAADLERVKGWLTECVQLHELARYFWHAATRIDELRRTRAALVHRFPRHPGFSALFR
jgi:hypothetical protein